MIIIIDKQKCAYCSRCMQFSDIFREPILESKASLIEIETLDDDNIKNAAEECPAAAIEIKHG